MTPSEADAQRLRAAAYVHIPFCSAVCPYCDFAVVAGRDDVARRYVDAVVTEIGRAEPWLPLGAVYFGGGTPSHVEPALLAEILTALERRHGLETGAEISLEVNPEDFATERATRIRSIGFNRVSFGAQSFDADVLAALGRRHGPEDIALSISAARGAGFPSVSLDLIYGTPLESEASWSSTVEQAVNLAPDHVSAYALTVEPGTGLGVAVGNGAPAPDPDAQATMYEVVRDRLEESGYHRYEVSNWARPGHECRYNMTVWAQGEYLAYGNGAHGHRAGARYRNYRLLNRYIEAVECGTPPMAGQEPNRGWDAELDRVFVGLRRSVGVGPGPGVDAFVGSSAGSRLIEAGVVRLRDERLVISRPLLTDEVHRVALGLEAPRGWAQAGHGDNVSGRDDA